MDPLTAKIISLLTLGFGSFVMGLVPAALSRYNLRRNVVLQTVLLCFGAGVLLATSLVHILAEVSDSEGYFSFANHSFLLFDWFRFVKTWKAI